MQLRHISPRSAEWLDAVYDGGGGREWQQKLAPDERSKLRHDSEAHASSSASFAARSDSEGSIGHSPGRHHGLAGESASR